jgi:hypothetical protein
MNYRPRRSSKRWTEKAPEYVLACYDNGGKTCDRYTVLFGGTLWEPSMGRMVSCLMMSNAPSHPMGVSMWDEISASDRACLGKHVRWLDLPEYIRNHVVARATAP